MNSSLNLLKMNGSFELEIFYRGSASIQNVILTGAFDEWSCIHRMPQCWERKGEKCFRLAIPIGMPKGTKKTEFKFIVDGQWTCSNEFPREFDGNGNENNTLCYGDGIVCPQVKWVNPDEPEPTPPVFKSEEKMQPHVVVKTTQENEENVEQPNPCPDDSAINLDNPSNSSPSSSPPPSPSPCPSTSTSISSSILSPLDFTTVTCNNTNTSSAEIPQELPKKRKINCSFGSIMKLLAQKCMRKFRNAKKKKKKKKK